MSSVNRRDFIKSPETLIGGLMAVGPFLTKEFASEFVKEFANEFDRKEVDQPVAKLNLLNGYHSNGYY